MKGMNSNIIFYCFILSSLALIVQSKNEIPIAFSDTGLPTVNVYFAGEDKTKQLILDIGQEKSWLYNKKESKDEKNLVEVKYDLFSLKGESKKSECHLNGKDDKKHLIENFEYLDISNKKGEEPFLDVISLSSIINGMSDKTYAFNLDFPSKKLNLLFENKEKENLNKLELATSKEGDKWKLNLTAVFFDKIDLNQKSGEVYKITNKTLGTMINRNLILETVYSSFYVPRDFFAFLETNYFFDGKEPICQREIKDGNIVYICNKNEKDKIKNINLVINNKYVLQLTNENLLKCTDNSDVCEFNIRYDPKINDFVFGVEILKKYNIYFMKNEKCIYLDKSEEMPLCDLSVAQFKILGKKDKIQALFELLKTFSVIVAIFIFLFIFFYIHSKWRGHIYEDKEDDKKEELADIEDKEK